MKKIDRQALLDELRMVSPGLSNRESLEQSNCFVFKDGSVFTFNDEIACRKKLKLKAEQSEDKKEKSANVDLGIEGAVTADLLLKFLEKTKDKTLEVFENENGELEFKGKGGKATGMNRDADILLPIEKVLEEKLPKVWNQLPTEFEAIISKVRNCVSTNEENFDLTCIHINPDFIEAGDNTQVIRWRCKTGISEPVLIRGAAAGHIVSGVGFTEVCVTASWVHFKAEKGLIMSCRKFHVEEYPDWSVVLKGDGNKITLDKRLITAAEVAALLAGETVAGVEPQLEVFLKPGKAIIKGTGLLGWHREPKKVNYTGPKLRFYVSPSLLCYIANEYQDCMIHNGKLIASGGFKEKTGKWTYVTVLQSKKKSPIPEEETKEAA